MTHSGLSKFLKILNAGENHLDSQTDNIKPVLELEANCNKTFMQRNCHSFQPESKSFLQYLSKVYHILSTETSNTRKGNSIVSFTTLFPKRNAFLISRFSRGQ